VQNMTFPPPPEGPGFPAPNGLQALQTSPNPFGAPVDVGSPKKSSLLPLGLSILFVVSGALLYVFREALAANEWFIVGYLLTPLLATMALGYDSMLNIRGQRDPWYSRRRFASAAIRTVVILGFVVGVFHILELGRWLGESAVQGGWF
jgi:hypothetical protein